MHRPAPDRAGTPLFQLHNHQLSYADQQGEKVVLADLSLCIHAGEKVALVGSSGSGKSTLLKLLRQQQPDSAYCPQHLGLVGPLSVFHNLYMGRLQRYGWRRNLRNLVWPSREQLQATAHLATELGLDAQLRRSVDRLSGGQQQRTALGRALYQQSPIFIGDEPVSSVDEFQADQLLGLINRAHATVVVALHDQTLALKHYERIIGLRGGRLVLDAPAATLTADELAAVYHAP